MSDITCPPLPQWTPSPDSPARPASEDPGFTRGQEFRAAPRAEGHPTPPSFKAEPRTDGAPSVIDAFPLPDEGWALIEHLLRERSALIQNTTAAQARSSESLEYERTARRITRAYVAACADLLAHEEMNRDMLLGEWNEWKAKAKALATNADLAYAALESWAAKDRDEG